MDGVQKPPPGGDQHRGHIIILINSVFMVLASIAIALRIYVRIKLVPSMSLDDYTAVVAWVSRKTLKNAPLPDWTLGSWRRFSRMSHR